jgi:uncharacterized membrane protein YqiK
MKMGMFDIFGGMIGLYKVVPPDEAHVRVMFNKKQVFMSKKYKDIESKPSYWKIPFVTRISKLPLTNIRIDVPDIKLNDIDMAKFMCDIVCFVNIEDPLLAAERTGITTEQTRYEGVPYGIKTLSEDFRAIMESIGRTVATKQTILDVYKNRQQLDDAVTHEIESVFPKWGLQLVDLEIKDLKDVVGSTIIADIEKKKAATITADARVKVAEENKRAVISEAENQRESELKKAEAEETWRKRQIEKERTIAISEQEKTKQAAEKELEANAAKVEAMRKLNVGQANVDREATIQRAEATKVKLSTEAEGLAKQIESVGMAEAGIIKAKKVAEAEGTDRLAIAQQKFNEAATNIEVIKANKEVQIAYAEAYKAAFEKANINIVAGSTSEILSGTLGTIKVGPKEGMSLQQFMDMNPQLKSLLDKVIKDDKPGKA